METLGLVEVLDSGVCRHCHLPILKVGKRWWHLNRGRVPAMYRTCRAASNDEQYPNRWTAKP